MRKILFVHNNQASFIRLDLEELRKGHEVTECYLGSRFLNPVKIWKQVRLHDVIFGWFASWHTFLPLQFARVLRKPSLLVIGGYDVANMAEIGYGHQRRPLTRWVSRSTMKAASCLLPFSGFSRSEAERNASVPGSQLHSLYLGVLDLFGSLPGGPRARMALTVGNVDRPNLRRKGHEPFVRTAALLPDVNFVVAGAWKDDAIDFLKSIATPNVTFTGRVSDSELLDLYRRASVYVQASLHEGFGLSVAEAMLAGCVPVVTRAGALPEVVGEEGIFVDQPEPKTLAEAIELGLGSTLEDRVRSRQRILTNFSMESRSQGLKNLIDSLLTTGQHSQVAVPTSRRSGKNNTISPFVSVVMPIRNEAKFIERSLGAVLAQHYPPERMEVLVADGMSSDDTRKLVSELAAANPVLKVRVIDNPGGIVPTGMNAAIVSAKGEMIIRVDGHTAIAADYVSKCVDAWQRSGADNVGGRMTPLADSSFGKAVAAATSSSFGVGGARFHYSENEEYVDTVYMGAWPITVFQRIGLFDEEMVRNQDDEFNYRLRRAGGRILLDPNIKSLYYNRSTIRSLWRQYFQYGYWKVRVMQKHPRQMQPRQFVPALFVAALLIGLFLTPFLVVDRYLLGLVAGAYASANLLASAVTARKREFRLLPLIGLAFVILHVAYGVGFLWGLIRFSSLWRESYRLRVPRDVTASPLDTL